MSDTNHIVIDQETAEMAGGLLSTLATVAGHPELAVIITPAAKLAARLSDAGYEVPSLSEFKAKLAEFEGRGDVPTA